MQYLFVLQYNFLQFLLATFYQLFKLHAYKDQAARFASTVTIRGLR